MFVTFWSKVGVVEILLLNVHTSVTLFQYCSLFQDVRYILGAKLELLKFCC